MLIKDNRVKTKLIIQPWNKSIKLMSMICNNYIKLKKQELQENLMGGE